MCLMVDLNETSGPNDIAYIISVPSGDRTGIPIWPFIFSQPVMRLIGPGP